MSAQPVDVLAVLRDAAYEMHNYTPGARQPMDEAVAAVAELIEADVELDAAYAEFPPAPAEKVAVERGAARINAARRRRAAALARCGGTP